MTAPPDPGIALIQRWYEAYDTRAIDDLCAISHPEIVVVPASPLLTRLPGTSFHGHAGLRTLMTWSYENYPHARVGYTSARTLPAGILARTTYLLDGESTSSATASTFAIFRLENHQIYRVHSFARESEALAFSADASVLTAREREVLQLLVRGLTAPQIASELFLSPATVRTHVQNAMGRLGAHTRIQAVSLALKRGEIDL